MLNEIFETPYMRADAVDEALSSLSKSHPDMAVYRNYFYLLTHLDFDETDAVRHWGEFVRYHAKFEKDLGYPVDARITTLSYFINENKQLKSPKIIEMKIFQSTQDKVILDELTSLYNYRHFAHRIKAEIHAAADRDEMLSLVMVDIDDFKHINDDYGHLTGDCILRQIATLMKAELSDQGDVYRYGGEEFAVILPRVSKQEVFDIASGLCNTIATHAFINENSPSRHEMSVTVSLGIAVFPHDCGDSEALISNADNALYNAKSTGKNIACLYSENQRRSKRLDITVAGELSSFKPSRVSIQTRNVSKRGILFLCSEDLANGSVVELRLDMEKNNNPVTILCRIISKTAEVDDFIYGTDVVQIDRRDRVRFNQFLDSFPSG